MDLKHKRFYMLFNSYRNSLQKKLLLAFIGVGFFPFILFFIYTIYWAEQKIINKIIDEQSIQAQHIVDTIDSHINSLMKEIRFMAKLDLMDDIIADDLDRRVSRLLLQKKNDIASSKHTSLDVELFVVNNKGNIVASSDKFLINRRFKYLVELKNSYFSNPKALFISSQIFSSFDTKRNLGFLVLKYKLNNLNIFLRHQDGIGNTLYNIHTKHLIGEELPKSIELKENKKSYLFENDLIVYQKLGKNLQDWYLIYFVDKQQALYFYYDFLYFMMLILPIAFIITLFIGIYTAREVVKPIARLTHTTEEITKTKNYSAHVIVDTQDEVGRLSLAFNELLQTTDNALQALENENKLRLKRFIELIDIFNIIIKTETESECINTSLKEISKLTGNKKLRFIYNPKETQNNIAIYVNDFEKNEKIYFGSITLDMSMHNDTNEKKFYHSIVSMITLQLDRISLINNTMSISNAKSAFISSMSHELRTPLNSIIGFTQYMLVYEELNSEQEDVVVNIENSAQYLLEMINEILDIAKIEAGKMDIYLENITIKSFLDETVSMLLPLAEQKNLFLRIDETNIAKKCIQSDAKLLKQILINLVSNAIKFTYHGGVTLRVKEHNNHFFIHIKDTGIGISDENLKILFNDFTQIENMLQTEHKGSGLGLSLSKKLAQLLGGDIILTSDGKDKGSEAIISLKSI